MRASTMGFRDVELVEKCQWSISCFVANSDMNDHPSFRNWGTRLELGLDLWASVPLSKCVSGEAPNDREDETAEETEEDEGEDKIGWW